MSEKELTQEELEKASGGLRSRVASSDKPHQAGSGQGKATSILEGQGSATGLGQPLGGKKK